MRFDHWLNSIKLFESIDELFPKWIGSTVWSLMNRQIEVLMHRCIELNELIIEWIERIDHWMHWINWSFQWIDDWFFEWIFRIRIRETTTMRPKEIERRLKISQRQNTRLRTQLESSNKEKYSRGNRIMSRCFHDGRNRPVTHSPRRNFPYVRGLLKFLHELPESKKCGRQ